MAETLTGTRPPHPFEIGSFFEPRATTISAPSGNGRCSASASTGSAVNHVSISADVVRITGIAFGWITPTSAFGSQVRKANRSVVTGPSFTFRVLVHASTQMPAKNASGRSGESANHAGGRLPSGCNSDSEKLVNGTMQRLGTPSQRRQCPLLVLRTFVTPGSVFLPAIANTGEGMPQRTIASSRPSPLLRTIGAA